LAGLSPGTTYHYRIVASNANGRSLGADQSFVTPTPPPVAMPKPVAPKTSVRPFRVTIVFTVLHRHRLGMTHLTLTKLSGGARVAYSCTKCGRRHAHGTRKVRSSEISIRTGKLILTRHSRLTVTVTASDGSSRTRVYTFHPRSKIEPDPFVETCQVVSTRMRVPCS
jgi:hypothetical protein